MADWTYIPTKGAEWRPLTKSAPPPVLKSPHSHSLEYKPNIGRWVCAVCGYKLGDGRKQFLAPCPPKKQKPRAHEFMITHPQPTPRQGELLLTPRRKPKKAATTRKKQTDAKRRIKRR